MINRTLFSIFFGILLLQPLAWSQVAGPKDNAPLSSQHAQFVAAKEAQARKIALDHKAKVPPQAWSYFEARRQSKWLVASNLFHELVDTERMLHGMQTSAWHPLQEVEMLFEQLAVGEPHYLKMFADEIISSIPKRSLYFGGTAPGRGLVTAASESHINGDPIFTLTQNALADGTHMQYLRHMYGDQLKIPSTEDMKQVFQEYLRDANARRENGTLRPGENVRIIDNKVQVSGFVAVMTINGLLVKKILQDNPDRECYVEESYPIHWMYPHLSPHGLILKLNRTALKDLPTATIKQDQKFWSEKTSTMIGPWLTDRTTLDELCDFVDKVHLRTDLNEFEGDRRFVGNTNACSTFSDLRAAIAGVYAYRIQPVDRKSPDPRMRDAADLAFKQAFALYPGTKATTTYAHLLLQLKRRDDAIRILELAARIHPNNKEVTALLEQTRKVP